MREWTTPPNPWGYLCKRWAAHSCVLLCAITALVSEALLNRGFHSQSHRCRNALAVTSLAATSSGFSNNETSPRTWSTGLDLIWCIKIDLWRQRGQLMNSLLLLFGRWEWQMTFSAEKSGEKILSASRDKRSFFSPQDSFLGRTVLVPFKDIYIRRLEIYISLHKTSLTFLIWLPKPFCNKAKRLHLQFKQ